LTSGLPGVRFRQDNKGMATSDNNVSIPEDLLAELKAQAARRGLTVDEVAVETLRDGLREQSWQAKVARWSRYGKASEYSADQVPDVVDQWRNEQRGK
jgi:hypothetical protein